MARIGRNKEPKIHRDSWKQEVTVGDWVMITTSHDTTTIGQIVRTSNAGTWWLKRLPGPGQKYSGRDAQYLLSERKQTIKIEVDETVLASLIITESFLTPPKITISLF